MPQTARPMWNNKNMLINEVPRGISTANEELSKSGFRSIKNFYGLSKVLVNYSPPFALENVNIVELERIAREALKDTLAEVYDLLTWNVNWNSYDSLAPSQDTVDHAANWIVRLFQVVADLGWIKPNVTASADGEVVFEWWYQTKKLTIYIGDQSAEYVQVWGTNVNSSMSDGNAEPIAVSRSLWLWLIS